MDYNKITKYLDKFKKIVFEKENIYKVVSQIILKHTNILIKINLIKIKNTTIYIQCSPIQKSEILIHKNEIILDFKKLIPNYSIINIK